MTTGIDILALQREIDEVNRASGWRELNVLFTEAMALLVSEMSEAVDAWRKWGLGDMTGRREGPIQMGNPPTGPPKPEGVGSEFADIAIRLLDDCALFGVRIDEGMLWLQHWSVPQSLVAAMRTLDRVSCKAEDAYDTGDMTGVARQFTVLWLQLGYFARHYGIDLGFEIERKMAFNRTRSHRHGGKRM